MHWKSSFFLKVTIIVKHAIYIYFCLGASWVVHGCFQAISWVCQGYFKINSRLFKCDSWVSNRCAKGVYVQLSLLGLLHWALYTKVNPLIHNADTFESSWMYSWTVLEVPLKYSRNTLETPMKHPPKHKNVFPLSQWL